PDEPYSLGALSSSHTDTIFFRCGSVKHRHINGMFKNPASIFHASWESVRVILRCEAKEILADARPQARKTGGVLAGIR
ncbi:MAG: hypothetical protein ABI980_16960, partial [Nitrospirota bacterium]